MRSLFEPERAEIAPGAVHVPDWLSLDEQRHLVEECRGWAKPGRCAHAAAQRRRDVRADRLPRLALAPYRYSALPTTSTAPRSRRFPDWLVELGEGRSADAWGIRAPGFRPDAALINFYDEREDGDAPGQGRAQRRARGLAEHRRHLLFRFGNTERAAGPTPTSSCALATCSSSAAQPLRVPRRHEAVPGTADPAPGLSTGRLNLTLRVSGLDQERPRAST